MVVNDIVLEAGPSAVPDFADTVTAWPTKLALVPVMADRVRQLIPQEVERLREQAAPDHVLKHWPRPVVALPPWETHDQWNIDD